MSRVRGELHAIRVVQFLTTDVLLIALARITPDRIGGSEEIIPYMRSNVFVGSMSHA